MKASLFPLSSRAQPTYPGVPWRDLQFRGPFLEMFFDLPSPLCCTLSSSTLSGDSSSDAASSSNFVLSILRLPFEDVLETCGKDSRSERPSKHIRIRASALNAQGNTAVGSCPRSAETGIRDQEFVTRRDWHFGNTEIARHRSTSVTNELL
jgi:hypothetical protein